MPHIHRPSEIELVPNKSPILDFSWKASPPLEELSNSKYLHFDIKSLLPGRFSYPYHFHRNAEELFIIMDGEGTLRTPQGYQNIIKGDILFFEEGESGTHQLYNHSEGALVYIDIRTKANIDVCEYPDSGKINILPAMDIFKKEPKVPYYSDEENVKAKWPKELLKRD